MKSEKPIEDLTEVTNDAKAEVTAETVKIKLPLTREKQGDVFVSINGQNWLLQRGVEIEVPKAVAEVLENSREMDELAITRQRTLASGANF